MHDSLGRAWQMGTVQLDSQMPARFGLTYVGADNVEHTPYVVHRALMGSIERFIGILTEHYAAAFPFWIAPVQVRILPVGESHRGAALDLAARIPYRVEVDTSDDTVGKRIRNAEVEKIPFVVVYGDKESDEALAIREHGGAQETLAFSEFVAKLATLVPWQAGAEPSLTS
jgi:threonyl-tRNA synthetase